MPNSTAKKISVQIVTSENLIAYKGLFTSHGLNVKTKLVSPSLQNEGLDLDREKARTVRRNAEESQKRPY